MDISRDGTTLALAGQFDVRNTMEVRAAIYEHLTENLGDVVIDLTEVTTVDVTALKVLAYATRTANRQGQSLRLRGCGPYVRRLLHMTHLIRFVEIERDAVPA